MSSQFNYFIKNCIQKKELFDFKKFSYFIKSRYKKYYLIDSVKLEDLIRRIYFVLSKIKDNRDFTKRVLLIGLSRKESNHFRYFNKVLKKMADRYDLVYTEWLHPGDVYDYYSRYYRHTKKGFKEKVNLPLVILTFSSEYEESIFKEYSFAGVPSFYFVGISNVFDKKFKDYPLLGYYSVPVLSFYLDLLNCCLNMSIGKRCKFN